ncbi:hypothetical protein BC835DRAFT_1363827 [Cytidiella melzeri]|nr:hypothetical protein BC835DRAFT_1363827 [Cytidiella melzeri]
MMPMMPWRCYLWLRSLPPPPLMKLASLQSSGFTEIIVGTNLQRGVQSVSPARSRVSGWPCRLPKYFAQRLGPWLLEQARNLSRLLLPHKSYLWHDLLYDVLKAQYAVKQPSDLLPLPALTRSTASHQPYCLHHVYTATRPCVYQQGNRPSSEQEVRQTHASARPGLGLVQSERVAILGETRERVKRCTCMLTRPVASNAVPNPAHRLIT